MAIKDVLKRTVKEDGIVLYNQFKPKMDTFTDKATGKPVDAQPDRWLIGVICGTIDSKYGFNGSRVTGEFKLVTAAAAEKFTYLSPVIVTLDENGDRYKITDIELKPKK